MHAGRKAREQTSMCHIDYSDQNNSSHLVPPASLSCFLRVGGGFFFSLHLVFHFPRPSSTSRDGVAVNLAAPWRTEGWRPRGDAGLVYAAESQRKPRKQGGRMGCGEEGRLKGEMERIRQEWGDKKTKKNESAAVFCDAFQGQRGFR